MIKTGALLTVAQTTSVLFRALGAGRQWVDMLNDHRQARGDLKGAMLLPVARHGNEPVYRPSDVEDFVRAVRDAYGSMLPFPTKVLTFTYNDAAIDVNDAAWRLQKVKPVSSSAARR